jgi:hypothetical protein
MNIVHSTHQFADAATAQIQGLRRYVLSTYTFTKLLYQSS